MRLAFLIISIIFFMATLYSVNIYLNKQCREEYLRTKCRATESSLKCEYLSKCFGTDSYFTFEENFVLIALIVICSIMVVLSKKDTLPSIKIYKSND
jgi:hypothetical protein